MSLLVNEESHNIVCDKLVCDKLVCDKHDIILKRNKEHNNIFTLHFEVKNPNMLLRKLIDLKLYNLMYELNKDVLERVEICMKMMTVHSMYCLFKRFGSELGIAQKYMLLHTTREEDTNTGNVRIMSKSIPSNHTIEGCEVVNSKYANLVVSFHTEHHAEIHYEFHMDMEDDLPTYMENIVGLLMKKIFFRLKTFIENMH